MLRVCLYVYSCLLSAYGRRLYLQLCVGAAAKEREVQEGSQLNEVPRMRSWTPQSNPMLVMFWFLCRHNRKQMEPVGV